MVGLEKNHTVLNAYWRLGKGDLSLWMSFPISRMSAQRLLASRQRGPRLGRSALRQGQGAQRLLASRQRGPMSEVSGLLAYRGAQRLLASRQRGPRHLQYTDITSKFGGEIMHLGDPTGRAWLGVDSGRKSLIMSAIYTDHAPPGRIFDSFRHDFQLLSYQRAIHAMTAGGCMIFQSHLYDVERRGV